MEEIRFLIEVGVVLAAALVGGLVARALHLPVLVGYLLIGVAVGPHTPGFIADAETIRAIADLGVALLVFAVGVQLSFRQLAATQRTALLGGAGQIAATIVLGALVGRALGWGTYAGLFLGCAIAHTSTTVIIKVLEAKGEIGSTHGAIMLGISVVQDLSFVLMVALLPALVDFSWAALPDLGATLLKAALFLGVALLLALRTIPALLERAAHTNNPELFVLTVVCVCLAAAATAHVAGFSLALGAFIAGLVVSESEYAHEVFAQVRPLRDVFASLFFVSIGMLMQPRVVAEHWPAVLAVVLAILVGKFLVSALPVYLLGWHGRTAILAGVGLAQIGEFSFLLTKVGSDLNLIVPEVGAVVLAAALITLFVAPFLYNAAGPLYEFLNRQPHLSRLLNRVAAEGMGEALAGSTWPEPRVIVLGYGRVGQHVSHSLAEHAVPHVVVEYDPARVAELRTRGIPVMYGDASSEPVLTQVRPERAAVAVVALPEAGTTERAVQLLRRLAPECVIVARVHQTEEIPHLRAAGADDVIFAEFEASLGILRRTLMKLGMEEHDVETHIERARAERYDPARHGARSD